MFNDVELNIKDFYDAKKAIPLNLVDINSIIISNKVKNNNDTSKYFIGYLNDTDEITTFCIILPQMTGVVILNILKMEETTCHLKLKMRMCISDTIKNGITLWIY